MTTVLDEEHAVRLAPEEMQPVWDALDRAASGGDVASLDPDGLVDAAVAVTAALPQPLLQAVYRYRRGLTASDVLLLRGLLPPHADPGPTPRESTAPLAQPWAQRGALCLLGVAQLLGEPFNFRTLYGGKLVQHVVPVPSMEHTQTGESSEGLLDWHVEDGFTDDRCDYFGLLCMRGDPSAETLFSSARDVELPGEVRDVLRQQRFHMVPDTAHVLDEVEPLLCAALAGPGHAPEICFDAFYLSPADPDDDEAAGALAALREALDRTRIAHVLTAGDLLVLDNRRLVHARTSFTPRYDERDRWLMRTMVCASIPRYRRWGRRIIG